MGAFGKTLASYYHLSDNKTATLSWSEQSTFAITRLHSEVGLPGISNPIPEEPAIHVAVSIKPVPLKSFELSIDNHRVPIKYIPAFHTNVMDLQSNPVCSLNCGFDYVHYHVPREGLDEIAREHKIRPVGSYRLAIGEDDPAIAQMTKNVLPFIGSQEWSGSLALDQFSLVFGAHLLQRYAGLSRLPSVAQRGLAPWQERRATELLREHLDGNIHLARVAQECCMSTSYFARSFKVSYGISPHRWLIERRIERAKELLKQSGLPLIDIALQSGFSDQAAFTRTFRRFMGDSPGRWRRERAGREIRGARLQVDGSRLQPEQRA
jgi:AraC family transcriptional regulator